MSKLVKVPKSRDFQFRPSKPKVVKTKVAKDGDVKPGPDWDGWLDKTIKAGARRMYKVVEITRTDGGTVCINTEDMTTEERATEDALRVVEKATAEKKRAEKAAKEAVPESTEETPQSEVSEEQEALAS